MLSPFLFVIVSTLNQHLTSSGIEIDCCSFRQAKLNSPTDGFNRDFIPFALKRAMNAVLRVFHLSTDFAMTSWQWRAEVSISAAYRRNSSPSKNPLLHIWDFYDTALRLRILWILHHSDVQFFLAFAERDACCAIARVDLKYVQKLGVRRYFQNLAAEPLGNINVAFAVDLHAIRSNPPAFDLVWRKKV